MSDNMVPREQYDLQLGHHADDSRRNLVRARAAERERDEARAQLAAVRAWRKALGEGYAGPGGIILDLDAALAAATPPAPSSAEEAASVLDAEADRWDKMNGMAWCSMVGRSLHRRADEMREEAKK